MNDRHFAESADVATGERTRLAEGRHPVPSPDERQVAFLGVDGQFCTVAAGGSTSRVRTDEHGGVADFNVAWSPDSRRLAYGIDAVVRVLALGDGRITALVEGGRLVTGLDWFPDGGQLADGRLADPVLPGRRTLTVVSVPSGNVRVLTDHGSYPLTPKVSPDRRLMVFVHVPHMYNP